MKVFVRLTEIFKTKTILKEVCECKKNAIVTERGLLRHSRIRTPLTWLGAQVREEPREQGTVGGKWSLLPAGDIILIRFAPDCL